MEKNMIGTKKHGWEINNKTKQIIVYSPVSLYEKLIKKSKVKKVISFDKIEELTVSYTKPMSSGAYHKNYYLVAIRVKTINGEIIEFEAMRDYTIRDDLLKSFCLLSDSGLVINDKFNIISKLVNSDERIWDILNKIDNSK